MPGTEVSYISLCLSLPLPPSLSLSSPLQLSLFDGVNDGDDGGRDAAAAAVDDDVNNVLRRAQWQSFKMMCEAEFELHAIFAGVKAKLDAQGEFHQLRVCARLFACVCLVFLFD